MAHILKRPIFPCVLVIVSVFSLAFAASLSLRETCAVTPLPNSTFVPFTKVSQVMDIFLELTFLEDPRSVWCVALDQQQVLPPELPQGATTSTLPQLSGWLRLQEPS